MNTAVKALRRGRTTDTDGRRHERTSPRTETAMRHRDEVALVRLCATCARPFSIAKGEARFAERTGMALADRCRWHRPTRREQMSAGVGNTNAVHPTDQTGHSHGLSRLRVWTPHGRSCADDLDAPYHAGRHMRAADAPVDPETGSGGRQRERKHRRTKAPETSFARVCEVVARIGGRL